MLFETTENATCPLDAIHLDINYMKTIESLLLTRRDFPNPKAFTEKLAREGVKVVTIVDPGVKYQPKESNGRANPDCRWRGWTLLRI
jgi:alpha-glucosidase (family GH31 glycosyl hydrolase)